MEFKVKDAFAIWVTGLPASGKSTLAASLKARLADRGIDVAVLESDVLRRVLTPHPQYDEEERDTFYRQLVYIGALLTKHGVPVIFDATANRRRYRNRARQQIPRFFEVFVDCPLKTCLARDPKGIYNKAFANPANTVPGLREPYEPPEKPDIVVQGEETPDSASSRVIRTLEQEGFFDSLVVT